MLGCSEKGGLQIHVQWQGMSAVEMQGADKGTRNTSDSVAKCQERTANICDIGLQTMQEMQ
jgi:hypothetical protein